VRPDETCSTRDEYLHTNQELSHLS
jgi:hypothetical protein